MSVVALSVVVLAAATVVAALALVLFSDPVRWPNGSRRILLITSGVIAALLLAAAYVLGAAA